MPLIAMGREAHHPSLDERLAKPPPAPGNPTPLEAMAHQSGTPGGKKLHAPRKQVPEPVFGIIRSVPGFRQFPPRGIDRVRGKAVQRYEIATRVPRFSMPARAAR